MKGLLISLGVGLGLTAVYAVKQINDDRKETVVATEGNTNLISKETFKQAAKRKVNDILTWVAENGEKVESIVKSISIVSTVLGVCTTAIQLYSSSKRVIKDPDEELYKEVREINARLRYLTPDIKVQTF